MFESSTNVNPIRPMYFCIIVECHKSPNKGSISFLRPLEATIQSLIVPLKRSILVKISVE